VVLVIADGFVAGLRVNGFAGALVAAVAIGIIAWLLSLIPRRINRPLNRIPSACHDARVQVLRQKASAVMLSGCSCRARSPPINQGVALTIIPGPATPSLIYRLTALPDLRVSVNTKTVLVEVRGEDPGL
jgi:hypothetical protein